MTDYRDSEKVISAFLNHCKVADIARASGLSRNTIYKLRADEDFQTALNERRKALIQSATDKMRSYLLKDVEVLQQIAESSETPAGTRVYAVATLMTQLNSWIQITEIEERITALERAKKDENAHF